MINLNPRYAMIDYNINEVKKIIKDLDYVTLLDLCPRIVIPKNSLFYHSTKLSIRDIQNNALQMTSGYYPKINNCQTCQIKDVPFENIGDKPRIMELSVNPNKSQYKKCICQTGTQERLYGNFNFSGNYDIALGKTILKATEILVNTEDVILIDLNYLSVELGFSPKRFIYNGNETMNGFGAQKNWTTYCKNHKIDGLVMVDVVDIHPIDLTHKTNLSCYHYQNKGIVCPEFVLISKLGAEISKEPIGTEKLKILGIVDLYDNDLNVKLSRDEVEQLFQLFFKKLEKVIYPIQLDIIYLDGFTLFKTLLIKYQGKEVNMDFIFDKMIKNADDFYITADERNTIRGTIYKPDLDYLQYYHKELLELYDPTLPKDIEIYSDIKNFLNLGKYYYYKDGQTVNYASNRLFDHILTIKAEQLNVNIPLYVNYDKLSSIKNYNQYTLELIREENVKKFIDTLELDIIINFYINCYVKYNQLDVNLESVKDMLDMLYESFLNTKLSLTEARNKNWEQFKTTYLEPVEKYICHFNHYKSVISTVITLDNTMVQYIFYLFESNLNITLDELLTSMDENLTTKEQNQTNIDFFNTYNLLLSNKIDRNTLLIQFVTFINQLIGMTL